MNLCFSGEKRMHKNDGSVEVDPEPPLNKKKKKKQKKMK